MTRDVIAAATIRELESEKEFQARVIEYAKKRGWRSFHISSSVRLLPGKRWVGDPSSRGFPDLVFVRDRGWPDGPVQVIFAELKAQRGRILPEQREVNALLLAAGARAFIWKPSDWDEIVTVLA